MKFNNYKYPISVLISAYNVENYISDAIESVLNQTFHNFEFVIINDGSSDSTESIINKYSDNRIRLISNNTNKGLIYSLNYGLSIAKGKYIARMDADDLMPPNRLKKQFEFLEMNPDTHMLGGAHQLLNTNIVVPFPKYNEEIKIKMLKSTGFSHPTVMIRNDTIKRYQLKYDEKYPSAEDYSLWVDMAIKGLKMRNLDDVFLLYRIHSNQTTQVQSEQQLITANRIRIKYYTSIFKDILTKRELELVKNYSTISSQNITTTFSLLMKLYYSNKKLFFFDRGLFRKFIGGIIYSNLETNNQSLVTDIKSVFFNKMPLRIRFFICKYVLKNIL